MDIHGMFVLFTDYLYWLFGLGKCPFFPKIEAGKLHQRFSLSPEKRLSPNILVCPKNLIRNPKQQKFYYDRLHHEYFV